MKRLNYNSDDIVVKNYDPFSFKAGIFNGYKKFNQDYAIDYSLREINYIKKILSQLESKLKSFITRYCHNNIIEVITINNIEEALYYDDFDIEVIRNQYQVEILNYSFCDKGFLVDFQIKLRGYYLIESKYCTLILNEDLAKDFEINLFEIKLINR